MKEYYIRFNTKEELKRAVQIGKDLGYSITCDYMDKHSFIGILILDKEGIVFVPQQDEEKLIEYGLKEIKLYESFKVGDYVRIRKCKTVYIITNMLQGDKVKIKNIKGCAYTIELSRLELASCINEARSNLVAEGTNTGCINYPISYLDTSQVSVDKQGNIKNTLSTNNNTMEKLNLILSKEFFDNKKNVKDIISLDTLLRDSIDLVVATKGELDKIQIKLNGLLIQLDGATNNEDVAMLKDLIESTKVIQEFVDELKGKTISKFENAKTKFDIVGYLKD